jgi:5-methylcytosine-specific restriction endonuclease McrA
MYRILIALLLAAVLGPAADARASSSSRSSRSASGSKRTTKSKPRSSRCTTCARDSKGRIARSATAKRDFQKSHPCPSTGKTTGACKGYVIDHVVPLKRGGADAPSNMQWQTKAAAKAKDKIE